MHAGPLILRLGELISCVQIALKSDMQLEKSNKALGASCKILLRLWLLLPAYMIYASS